MTVGDRMGEVETREAGVEGPTQYTLVGALHPRGLLARVGKAVLPTKIDPQDISLSRAEPATRRRPSSYILSFLLVVVLPSIAVTAYFGLLASDQYVAETRFAVK